MASHLSFSQLDLFLRCPRQWYATRFEKIEAKPAEALILGNAFHNTLEFDGNLRRMRKTPLDEENLNDMFLKTFLPRMLQEQDPKGELDHTRIRDMELRGVAMLKAYHNSVATRYWPIVVEDEFHVNIPSDNNARLLDVDGEPWTFTGRIDAITVNQLGRKVIVDWKTASKPWEPGAEHHKDQASAYIMAQLLRGMDIPHQVTFITFPTKWDRTEGIYRCGEWVRDEDNEKTGEFIWKADVRVTTRSLHQVGEFIYALRRAAQEINQIRAGEIPAHATPHGLCTFCPIYRDCLPGVRWIHRRGWKSPEHNFSPEQVLGNEQVS